MSLRGRIQRYVEMSLITGALEAINQSLIRSMGAKPDGEAHKKTMELYELVLNHKAFLPNVLDQFSTSKSAWSSESLSAALKEVGEW